MAWTSGNRIDMTWIKSNIPTAIAGLACITLLLTGCRDQQVTSVQGNPNGRNDLWSYVGFGGGGATFYPVVSPHNPDDAFLSCDMTGAYHTDNGGESWRMFNLRTVVGSYIYDPLDSQIVYALARGAGGGLYKSSDGGDTWSLHFPRREDVVSIVSRGDHAEETIVTKDSIRRHMMAFAIDPDNSSTLYSVIGRNDSVFFNESRDAGASWIEQRLLNAPVKNIFVHPGSDKANRTIYLTQEQSVTERRGGKWLTHSVPDGVKQITEYTGGFDSNSNRFVIYGTSGLSYFNPEGDQSGIHFTDNGGATWKNMESGLVSRTLPGSKVPEWRSVATSSRNPNVVYISYANFRVAKDTICIGVARSEDFGRTWSLVWRDKLTQPADIHASNREGGWIDERYGPTWGENPFSIGVSPQNPDVCYTTDFGRVLKTTNGGKHWDQVYTRPGSPGSWTTRGIEVTSNYNVIYDPFDNDHVFIANTDVGLMESHDHAKSWRSAVGDNGVPRQWINSTYWLTFDPGVKGKAWAAMSGTHDLPRPKMWRRSGISKFTGGIVETLDGGKTWRPLTTDLGESAMTHILIEPSSKPESRTLYVSAFGKGVYKSTDGGQTWSLKNRGIKGKEPFAWRIIRREHDGTLFLIVCRRSDDGSIGSEGDGALYRSTDQAESWQEVRLPEGVNGPMCVIMDTTKENTLVLSAWGRAVKDKLSPDVGGGIYYSNDDGNSWEHVLKNDQHIHDVTFDPRTNTYYACGFGAGAYKSADGRKWDRIRGFNFKWGRRVEPDQADSTKIFVLTFGGGVWYGQANGDSDAAEDILQPVEVF